MKLLLLLLVSCASNPNLMRLGDTKNTHYIKTERVIGLKCPDGYYLGEDYYCHEYHDDRSGVLVEKSVKYSDTVSVKKSLKRVAKIDCKKVFNEINLCMVSK